jgi:hypothetical protein
MNHVGHDFNMNDWKVVIHHDLKMRIRNPSGETAMQNGKWLKEISL